MNLNKLESFKCLKTPIKKHDLIKLQIEILSNQIKNLSDVEPFHEKEDIFELVQKLDDLRFARETGYKLLEILDLAVKGCDNL